MARQAVDVNNVALPGFDLTSPRLIAVCGGCLVLVWVLLGKIGLLLIGFACGVTLHPWLEQFRDPTKLEESRSRRELGIEIVDRLMKWQRPAVSSDAQAIPSADTSLDDFSDFRPSTARALAKASDAIVQQYVEWWYKPMLPSSTIFPIECRNSLVRFIRSTSLHLSRKRPADVFLHFLTNSSSIIIVFLSELASALGSETEDASCDTTESVHAYLQRYPESSLSNLLSPEKQLEKLRLVASDILHMFLDSQLYKCELTKMFLCEVLSGSVLESTIAGCSKPEYINGWIVYLLEQGEPDLINALDAGLEQATKSRTTTASAHADPTEAVLKDTSTRTTVGGREPDRGKNNTGAPLDEMMARVDIPSNPAGVNDMRNNSQRNSFSVGKVGDDAGTGSSGASEGVTTPTSSISEKTAQTEQRSSSDYPKTTRAIASPAAGEEVSTSATSTAANIIQKPPLEINQASQPPSHTLRNAEVSVIDDFNSLGEDTIFRSKPSKEYLLQVEPTSSRHQGWMVARQFTDFEALHEILRRISLISGASTFANQFATLPTWKGRSKDALRRELERYLREALRHNSLADSQGMATFFDKARESGNPSTAGPKGMGFTFPNQAAFETMGKGMLGALANAPKGVTGGGKAVIHGVAGVFGSAKTGNKPSVEQGKAPRSLSDEERSFDESSQSSESQEKIYLPNHNNTLDTMLASDKMKVTETHVAETHMPITHPDQEPITGVDTSPGSGFESHCRAPSYESEPANSTTENSQDWDVSAQRPQSLSTDSDYVQAETARTEALDKEKDFGNDGASAENPDFKDEHAPLSEDETMMTVELLFAVLNEMYSLSSVWKIRRALLNAAKSFLLRPGNPNLEYIRGLFQQSISGNTSDEAIGYHIDRLIETSVLTADGTQPEYHELSDKEKEALRVKARQLFIDRALPPALASVMGTSATVEALGRVFDSIQTPSVTRGLVFAVMLQAMKIVLQ